MNIFVILYDTEIFCNFNNFIWVQFTITFYTDDKKLGAVYTNILFDQDYNRGAVYIYKDCLG